MRRRRWLSPAFPRPLRPRNVVAVRCNAAALVDCVFCVVFWWFPCDLGDRPCLTVVDACGVAIRKTVIFSVTCS